MPLLVLAVSLGGVNIFQVRLPQARPRFNCRFYFRNNRSKIVKTMLNKMHVTIGK